MLANAVESSKMTPFVCAEGSFTTWKPPPMKEMEKTAGSNINHKQITGVKHT